jgi:hypothetical protein
MTLIDKIKEYAEVQAQIVRDIDKWGACNQNASDFKKRIFSEIESEIKALESRTLEGMIQEELMARCDKIYKKTEFYTGFSIDGDFHSSGKIEIDYILHVEDLNYYYHTLSALIAHMDKVIKE